MTLPDSVPMFQVLQDTDHSDVLYPNGDLYERYYTDNHRDVAMYVCRLLCTGFNSGFQAAVKLGEKTIAEEN